MNSRAFDIIIAGSGMAGISLCYRSLSEGIWRGKKIALIDTQFENTNDKTWCFWENSPGPFESIIFKRWQKLLFFSNNGSKKELDNGHYSYKMLRSADFYNHCIEFLKSQKNVSFITDTIVEQNGDTGKAIFRSKTTEYQSIIAFNSLFEKPIINKDETYFLQHFKGYFIETEQPIFDKKNIHLMDFRPAQKHGCTFMYVLPISEKKALIEYTLFTKTTLREGDYNAALDLFIRTQLNIDNYRVYHDEKGVIPMTDFVFERYNGNIINIGSAGGDTRASTGYTFQNTQKTITAIIEHYKRAPLADLPKIKTNTKHHLLDSTILKVFEQGEYPPHEIFEDLFSKTPAQSIFKFLDSESNLATDVKVMKSLRAKYFILPFIQSIIQYFKQRFR